MQTKPVVYVVDDDESVRKSLERLIRSAGYEVAVFASAPDFLACDPAADKGCLVLDEMMPGMKGLELQGKLADLNRHIPIIFISGSSNIPTSVTAMKAGAVDFLEKPFDEVALFDAIERALEKDRQRRRSEEEITDLRIREAALTPRERDVFRSVVAGMLNKQIAAELDIAEKTIKVHRSRVMQKMQANSLADLVRFAEKLK